MGLFSKKKKNIFSPAEGEIIALDQVEDELFFKEDAWRWICSYSFRW